MFNSRTCTASLQLLGLTSYALKVTDWTD